MNASTPASSADSAAADLDLLAAARRGDQAAFEQLVARHQRLVHGYIRARLADPSDLDDLCQEVFVRLYTGHSAPADADSGGLRAWLVGIARNVLREHARSTRRRETAWTALCLELESRHPAVTCDVNRFDDALTRLPRCLDGLGPSARQAIDLYYAANTRLRDIAVQMKRSEGALKLLVHRARQAVRRCLDTAATREASS